MKPFNLEEAKAGKPIVTRDGRKAKFIAHVPEAAEHSRVLFLQNGHIYARAETGGYDGVSKTDKDLFMAEPPKVKREGWVNVYKTTGRLPRTGLIYETPESAILAAKDAGCAVPLSTVRIEWEEEA